MMSADYRGFMTFFQPRADLLAGSRVSVTLMFEDIPTRKSRVITLSGVFGRLKIYSFFIRPRLVKAR
jgi:hypothetical protein